MMQRAFVFLLFFSTTVSAAAKQHVVAFGRWTTVKLFAAEDENQPVDIKIRPLIVDGHVKEFTFGPVHEVTEQTFVAQRIYKLNDSLPDENSIPRWRWERGGWFLVNKQSAKVQALALPLFDEYYSAVVWFRDYAAYCGVSDDGKKLFAIVAQAGRRKPLLKKEAGEALETDPQKCETPLWQRSPVRVTFGQPKFTYVLRSRTVDLVPEDEDSGEE